MKRIWFSHELECTATFWRIMRLDGITLGFTSHDRDLWFDGVLHAASPGMVPSSIRKSADHEPDSAEVRGSLSHDAICPEDLSAGRYDGALIRIGLVDWETLDSVILYAGTVGTISQEDSAFSAELVSRKAELWRDPTPRTSPTCRARFCGPGCNLNPEQFTRDVQLAGYDAVSNSVSFAEDIDLEDHGGGTVQWLEGAQAGIVMSVMGEAAEGLVLDVPLAPPLPSGTRARLRQGCDRTLATCSARFGNAVNFRAEPFLPGNDMLSRYPAPQT